MQNLDIEKQSIVLLTSYFKKPGKDDVQPLSPTEWKIFAEWLMDRGYTPGSLLSEDGGNIIDSWRNDKITNERLINLLKRGAQMSLVLEKWSRAGIWVLTRADADYPKKLKTKLGQLCPPVLFGSGNKNLLNMTGIAVVGSRSVTENEVAYSRQLGKIITDNNLLLISGGAKGVDETAMLAALENNGNAVGVLADSLFQKSISHNYRRYLSQNSLVLISPYYPDAGFNVGNAMGRNKYIYCLSEAAIVVHSGLHGGTWTGANENLKKRWVPLYVREKIDKESGNLSLIQNGGIVINDHTEIRRLIADIENKNETIVESSGITIVNEPNIKIDTGKILKDEVSAITIQNKSLSDFSFYEIFIIKLTKLLTDKELKQKELKNKMDIPARLLNDWLKKAETEGIIQKLLKPSRYKLRINNSSQADLFN